MRTTVFVFMLMANGIAYGQSYQVPTGPDLDDLYPRLSDSAFVVRGKVLAREAVLSRTPARSEQVGPNAWRVHYDPDRSGVLFTIAVEQVLCRREDFVLSQQAPAPAPSVAHVFVRNVANLWSTEQSRFDPNRRNRREFLLPDGEYLLFLWEPPGQDELVKNFKLEPGVVYYRTMEGERGAVRLPDAANPERPRTFVTPLVTAVRTFCDAVKAPDIETKIRNLNAVRDHSTDPAWRESVDAAIGALNQAQVKSPE